MGSKHLTLSQLGELYLNTQLNFQSSLLTMNKFFCFTVVMLAAVSIQDDVEFEPLPDYYSLLKVSPTAKTHEIKKSFRKLAMKYHPDKNKDELAQGIFQELSEAYSILSDAEKRRDYDELFLDEDELAEQYATDDSPASSPSEDTLEQISLNEAANDAPDSSDTANEQEDSAESSGEDVWDDIDDETLYKVLKFLADNDYEITKKTTFREIDPVTGERSSEHTRTKRSAPHREYYNRDGERMDNPWVQDPHQEFHPHHHQDYQFDDHYASGDRHYSGDYHDDRYANGDYMTGHRSRSAPTCQTYVRWEGSTKITRRSCY